MIIERAIERNELPPDADPNLIIESLIGPLWIRLLLTGEPVTGELAGAMELMPGCRAGG